MNSHDNPMAMNCLRSSVALCAALLCVAAPAAPAAAAKPRVNDYPTQDRVLYVQDCMRQRPEAPAFEMLSKCSCAIDRMAEQVRFADYVEMTTVVNAITIGGERGGNLRDNETVKPQIARWREMQSKVQKACFIEAPK
jgi:hypothetical protein